VINLLPPIELDDSDEWEVNQILACRFDHHHKGSGLLHLVEWRGFDNNPNAMSWELPKHPTNTPDMVQASPDAVVILKLVWT